MKKEYNRVEKVELKIYEFLGIKHFKKLVLKIPLLKHINQKNLTKAQKLTYFRRKSSNYFIGRKKDYENLKKFKSKLYSNTKIHLFALILAVMLLKKNFGISYTILGVIAAIENTYCIMLQRYNCIRINNTLRKMKPKYEKQKEELKQELIKEDLLLKPHDYTIIKNKKVKTVTFESLIQNLTLEELKQYKETLNYFKYAIEKKEYENNSVVERLDNKTFLKLKIYH